MERRNKLTPFDLEGVVDDEMYINPPHSTLTVCVLYTASGGTIVGQSACVDPANFDAALGKKLARENAVNQLWQLEGYLLLNRLKEREETLRTIAATAHEANAAYCRSIGDDSQPTWLDAPAWQKDSAINGVKMHFENPDATPRDSHASWYEEKLEAGWKWGEVKDADKKEHPCMVPYDDLPPEQQAKDDLYCSVVKTLLARLR